MKHHVSIIEGLKAFVPGRKHNLAIWEGRLSNVEIDALKAGAEPNSIKPEALLVFAPEWPGGRVPSVVPRDGIVTVSAWGE